MTAETLDIEANQTSTLLTTEARRFHTIPRWKLPRRARRIVPSIQTAEEFDRGALVTALREALTRRDPSANRRHDFLATVPHKFYHASVIPCPEELRLWLLMTTDPRVIDYASRETDWIDELDNETAIPKEEAFARLFDHFRRLEREYGKQTTRVHIPRSILAHPFCAVAKLYPLDELLEHTMASDFAIPLIHHQVLRWCKHHTLEEEANERACEAVARAIEEHIENPIIEMLAWESLISSFPSRRGLQPVLEQFEQLEAIYHHDQTFVRLMQLIEDRETFDRFVYRSNARVLFQPACAYTQVARFGMEDPEEMISAMAQKLRCKWGKEHWSLIFHLHAPEITELVLMFLSGELTPIDRTAPKAKRWLRREGANAVETLAKYALDEHSEHHDIAKKTLASYISKGHAELVSAHLGEEEMRTMGLANEANREKPKPTLELLRELEDHELPEWLARWSKRGLTAPYPPKIREQWLIPLENEDGEYLSQRAMFGVLRLLQEATRRPRHEIDLLRSHFTQYSRELLAGFLEGIWLSQGSSGNYRWLITAGALLGQEGTLELLREEMYHRPEGVTSYYHHVEQPRWVTRSLASLPGQEGVRLLFDDWMWRRQQRYPAHWRDAALERAAKERGVSYFALIESMLPELGIARNGKCYFELDGITFRYELDHDDGVLLSDRLEDGSWRELSIYHPNTTHAQARKTAKQEGSRLLELYAKLLVDVIEQGTTWNAFEWSQGLNHPVYRSCRRRVLWRILSKDRKHVKYVRVCEDGSLSDIHDDPVSLPAGCFVQPARWQELGDRALVAWSTLFADHEVVALGR